MKQLTSNVLTIKGFKSLNELKYEGKGDDVKDIYNVAIIADIPAEKLKKYKPTKYAELKNTLLSQSVTNIDPVYLIKYKGKIFGYCPVELETVEDMVALELFSTGKNLQALAALMFRPVKRMSRWAHRKDKRWENKLGIKVKTIKDFKTDKLTYRCEDIDFNNMDLSFWDQLPFQVLTGAMGFLMGSGVQFSLSIHPSSLKSPVIKKEIRVLKENLKEVMLGIQLRLLLPTLNYLNFTVNQEPSTLLHEKHVKSLLSYTVEASLLQLKAKCSENLWVITGDTNSQLLPSVLTLWDNVLKSNKMKLNESLTISGLMKATGYNNTMQWLKLT